MFLKADKTPRNIVTNDASRGAAGRANAPSIISADLKITGDLQCSGDIQIDGIVTGDIQSRNIVIGEDASVTGSLEAEAVQVYGKLLGQIKADAVTLERTAHVVGDILHKSLAIAQGAFLEGACKRIDTAPPAATFAAKSDATDETIAASAMTSTEKASNAGAVEDDDGNVQRLQVAG